MDFDAMSGRRSATTSSSKGAVCHFCYKPGRYKRECYHHMEAIRKLSNGRRNSNNNSGAGSNDNQKSSNNHDNKKKRRLECNGGQQ